MRLEFQEKPWDLYIAIGYSVASATILTVLNIGNLLAVVFVFFVPGYVLVAALFPGSSSEEKTEVDWPERLALAVGLSVAIQPLLGYVLNFTPWGIRFQPVVATTTLFSLGVGYVAYRRRMQLPADRRLSLRLDISRSAWAGFNMLDKAFSVALVAAMVVAAGAFAYVASVPRPGERFTEFYILGPGGNASGYPTNLTVNETGNVIVGVGNHEGEAVSYSVRVDLIEVRVVYNATSGVNETMEVSRVTLSWGNASLPEGQVWTQPYSFRIGSVGLWKIQFLLFKSGDFSSLYRELHLFVRVM